MPIVQGGMGVGVSLAGLASAVANQGGVGVISSAGLGAIYNNYSKDYRAASIWGLKEELRKAREATKGIIGVNVMVAMSNFADMVKTAIAEKADIIFSGAGLPLNLPSFLTEDAKTKLAPIVSSARAAKVLCQKWFSEYKYIPDAIVVEGPKAGGHLGYKADQISDEHYSLEAIVPQIVAEVRAFEAEHNCRIPVIACFSNSAMLVRSPETFRTGLAIAFMNPASSSSGSPDSVSGTMWFWASSLRPFDFGNTDTVMPVADLRMTIVISTLWAIN